MSGQREKYQKDVVVMRSFYGELPKAFAFVASIVACNMLTYSFPHTVLRVNLGEFAGVSLGIVLPLLIIVPVMFLLWLMFSVYNERYLISKDSVSQVIGMLSFATTSKEVYYTKIHSMEVEQNLIGKIFDTGNIKVFASTDNEFFLLRGIRNPEQYKGMIDRRREALQ